MAILSGATRPPARPMAAMIRPQLASSPYQAVLTRLDVAMATATRAASFVVRARVTRSSTNLVEDRKSTRLNSSHSQISYAVFCLKKKTIDSNAVRRTDKKLVRRAIFAALVLSAAQYDREHCSAQPPNSRRYGYAASATCLPS